MNPIFEIKYIEIQWYDKDTITRVEESLVSLLLEYNNEKKCFECETTIYPNTQGLRGQLAIRFLNNLASPPYVKISSGENKILSPINDVDTGKTWWILKDFWDKDKNFWRHSEINTVGTLRVHIQDQICNIFIGSVDFTLDQLDFYLSSFKDDLWELILDDSSVIQIDKTDNSLEINGMVIECINHLVSHAEKILNTPKAELREIQALKPRKIVKPVKRTFMELVNTTNHKLLTSRATTPSYNVAENRYILFALERSYRIIKQITILSGNKSKRYLNTTAKLQAQHDSFKNYIKINRDLVVKDLRAIGKHCQIDYWQRLLLDKLKSEGIYLEKHSYNHNEIFIRTVKYTHPQGSDIADGFFIKIFSNGQWDRDNGKTTILSCKDELPQLTNCLEPYSEYRIIGDINRREFEKVIYYSISTISLIEVRKTQGFENARKNFEEEKELGKHLSANNWIRKLSSKELEEQEKEKMALLNRIKYYSKNQKLLEGVYTKVAPKQKQLLNIIKALQQLGISPSSHFPNSMTFVQNPHYQGVHNSYKILRELTNLTDDGILINLEKIDSIGLVNMPLLYERWCLLQIIKVLKESFKFILQDDWQYKLISAITNNETDIAFSLSNTEAKRYITLTYEKTLDNRKRPDFVIDLNWYKENYRGNEHPHTKRFVLDAKFYNRSTFERHGGLMGIADQLYNKKNYRESTNNPVFILHPCRTVLPEQVTPQTWGKYSFLGELSIGGDELNPNHQYGGVFLSPIDRELYADELQRLLGLFLQYKLENSITLTNERSDDRIASQPFCIRCGSTNLRKVEKSLGYYNRHGVWVDRTTLSVWMQCNECEQFISFNHCATDKCATRLIKNGFYWTYHSARAIEPFNVKCPSCGEWGGW